MLINVIYTVTAFISTLIGSLSGMGGGVIMKPAFDLLGRYGAFETSVLTCCTMLAMSLTSVVTGAKKNAGDRQNVKKIIAVAAGSLTGGYAGELIFSTLVRSVPDSTVKIIQNAVLLAVVTLVIIYMKLSGRSLKIKSNAAGFPVGIALGLVSAFLGIGGGPLNVAVLTFVFGFEIKTAMFCSLVSVLSSQSIKALSILIRSGAGAFLIPLLPFVIAAGVAGALTGRAVNSRNGSREAKRMFIIVQFFVLAACAVNIIRFAAF